MDYLLREIAKSVVAAIADFIVQGRRSTPPVEIEGSFDDVMESQRRHDAAIAAIPVTTEIMNALTIEKRTAWMMNIVSTDERFACTWRMAQRALQVAPISFPLAVEQAWQQRVTKNW